MTANTSEGNALRESFALQERISARGFDWPDAHGVAAKLAEEVLELKEALTAGDNGAAQHELGDIFLAAVNLCRFLHLDPNHVLDQANKRFANRFSFLENALEARGLRMETCSLEVLDRVWIEIKSRADQELRNDP